MLRVVLGLLKGAVVGGAIGWVALKLGVGGGAAAFATYAVIGALVGIVCGKPPWRQDTIWTPALKGIVGLGIGIGMYWLAGKVLGGVHIALPASLGVAPERSLAEVPLLLGPVIGAVWGLLIELDDGGKAKAKDAGAAGAAPPPAKPRP